MYSYEQVAIIIPIYKVSLSIEENIALNQALKVFEQYDIFFVCPQTLIYQYKNELIKEIRIEDVWFSSVRKYSELMLQKEFYEKFIQYEYILVYQLDAFVFSDQLLEFCDMGYDYIGGLWPHGITHYKNVNSIVYYVGNGGFSLRRVSAFINWLSSIELSEVIKEVNEDILIAAYGEPSLKIASEEVALKFAFDHDPRVCFERNHHHLPFGCHAWKKIDLSFWKPFIEDEGYDLKNVFDNGCFQHYQLRYRAEDERNEYISKLQKNAKYIIEKVLHNRKMYIWGTGVIGTFAAQILNELGFTIQGFVDNYCDGLNQKHLNYPVLQGNNFLQTINKDIFVFIAVIRSEEIEKQLNELNWKHLVNYITLKDLDE